MQEIQEYLERLACKGASARLCKPLFSGLQKIIRAKKGKSFFCAYIIVVNY